MNFSTLTLRVLKTSDFVAFDGQPAPKPSMSTRCLPAETPGAQGLAAFPERPPSTLPSTQFFAPIPEAPAIAAKIFEISENVWGYDTLDRSEWGARPGHAAETPGRYSAPAPFPPA